MKNINSFDSFFEKKITKKSVKKLEKNVTITIAKKRVTKRSNGSLSCLTSGYGGKFFSIPKSQIKSISDSEIPVNDVYNEPAYKIVITEFIFDKIFKDYLERMSDYDLVIE